MGEQLWIIYALGSALGLASADALTKRFFAGMPPYGMILVRLLYASPFLGVGWLCISIPPLGRTFFYAVAAALPLETVAQLLYMRALKVSPISLCTPMLAFTPVLLILTGQILLGESLNIWGIGGIGLVALGSYILNLDRRRYGFLAPLAALWQEEGPRLMLLVAAIFACTSALGKLAVLNSAPAFFGLFYPCVFTGLMLSGYPWSRSRPGRSLLVHPGWGLVLGFCAAASILCHMHGIQIAPAAYLIALKRTSLVISVLYGGLWLKEIHFSSRLGGAMLMAAGVLVIAVKGS
ncbi:MAG: EamA family transporter [Deltaproteobacteria bacterium]|nr:EamA family transporter [Deltaproteobacteria bacterium]MBW1951901.1 EamA family transporter [Deltaproteobacteria bacterium]MBW1986957.1 EamA family transporter [Deltaproteobacteria bacterium]MBW2134472.1 EamA family transporter [Deltaproteobacteria bacterium]